MATMKASRTSKKNLWAEIKRYFYQSEDLTSESFFPLVLDTSMAYEYVPQPKNELLPPPSIMVSDDINTMLMPYAGSMVKSRFARMKGRFKAMLLEWFYNFATMYIPEDTGKLVSSYTQIFERQLRADQILIESDLPYAGEVEQMTDVKWTKPTTKEHAANAAANDLRDIIPDLLDRAYQFAMV